MPKTITIGIMPGRKGIVKPTQIRRPVQKESPTRRVREIRNRMCVGCYTHLTLGLNMQFIFH